MCGICGLIDYTGKGLVQEATIRKMCASLKHRGPDDEGVLVDRSGPAVGLGHRRLSIIDLSLAGHQPMSNEDGRIWTVFNGEIYNYHELTPQLRAKGHFFKSNTDTEVLVHLYEEYGVDCINYLRGMFAFALWDSQSKTLLLARDRVGKKPLLYSYQDGVFSFASEFASLLASGLLKKEIHHDSLHGYLTFGYVPAPFTIYKDIFKLPPAHRLILKNNKITVEKYWDLDYARKIKISEEDAASETLRILKEAVSIRLYSDVPLGAFLSGGIDSSTVVALMSGLSAKKIKTFSIGFEEKDYSELGYAAGIAKIFNTEHHEFIVKPDALKILPLLVERYGEPYADSSCIPTYYVSEQTKKYVTVALNGDGGDELFAGYERYQAMLIAEALHKFPRVALILLRRLSRFLPDAIDPKNSIRRAKRFLEAVELPFDARYLRWISLLNDEFKIKLYSDEFKRQISCLNSSRFMESDFNRGKNFAALDRLLDIDVHSYLPYDLLVKVDITSMANSLEARSPFLDHKLMEFAASLPAEFKLKGTVRKYILKKTIKNLIPKENTHRRKMGFGVPIGAWFRNELRGFLSDTLLSPASLKRGYFKPEFVRGMVTQHVNGKQDLSFQLWTLLMLELWHQRFMD